MLSSHIHLYTNLFYNNNNRSASYASNMNVFLAKIKSSKVQSAAKTKAQK